MLSWVVCAVMFVVAIATLVMWVIPTLPGAPWGLGVALGCAVGIFCNITENKATEGMWTPVVGPYRRIAVFALCIVLTVYQTDSSWLWAEVVDFSELFLPRNIWKWVAVLGVPAASFVLSFICVFGGCFGNAYSRSVCLLGRSLAVVWAIPLVILTLLAWQSGGYPHPSVKVLILVIGGLGSAALVWCCIGSAKK